MTRTTALLGSGLFLLLAPGTVAGVIPWLFTHWLARPPLFPFAQALGAAVLACGVLILLECFFRFAWQGLGTPAPVAPTKHLVIRGLYGYVRNPMYVGVLGAIVGQALWFGNLPLLGYGALIALTFHTFVFFYEEPTLRGTFGEEYERYCANVGRWLPRLTAWRG